MNRRTQTLAGLAFAVMAVACFATLDTTTQYITASVSVLLALWFRYTFQAVATTLVVWPGRGRRLLRTAHPRYQLLRGLLLLTTSVLAFFSLKFVPVGEFTAIAMITPLAITLIAATVLGETVSPLRWTLVAGGFAGTLIIIQPGADSFDWPLLLPLGLVVSNAWFQVLTSKLARLEDPVTTHFFTGWIGAVLTSLLLPFIWAPPQTWQQWAGLVLMGLTGTVGHFLLILAYARAPTATLMPYLYLQIGFAMFGGWLVFSHVPGPWALLGIGLVAACGAAGAWLTVRESQVRLQPVED